LFPRICGLFDTGFAGDAADVASLDFGVPADIDQSIFTYEAPSTSVYTEGFGELSTVKDETLKVDTPPVTGLDDWDFDMLDPLGGLEDPLADSSLDAFVNLDTFFMGDSFFDSSNQLHGAEEPAEVKPVIQFTVPEPALEAVSIPEEPTQTFLKPEVNKTSRKRKALAKSAAVETSLFKIPEVISNDLTAAHQADHDYMITSQGATSSSEEIGKSNIKKPKQTPKRRRVSSTTSNESDVSSTSSMLDLEDLDTPVDKQTIRRIKNNIASKRSREQRKTKLSEMEIEAETLIVRNEELRNKIVELEKLAKEMKELLVAKMSGKA